MQSKKKKISNTKPKKALVRKKRPQRFIKRLPNSLFDRARLAKIFIFSAVFAIVGIAALLLVKAEGPVVVTFTGSKMYVNNQQFIIRGVNYNPTFIGSDQYDFGAAANDIPKIKAMGANTVGTYMLGKSEYAQWSDLPQGDQQYQALMPAAEQAGLKVIVGYYANETIDWTNTTRVAKVTSQYQELVNKAKLHPATLMYMVGNELFEKLPNDTQRIAYAKWAGNMANWTHANDPNHPVFYADRGDSYGLSWLKAYAPNLDVNGVNNYSFSNAESLKTITQGYANSWPGKPVLIHEWGVDSLNVGTSQEDGTLQANNMTALASAVDSISANASYPLIGGLNFEFTDEWRFVGSSSTQDKDGGFLCTSCFDGRANEDFWGLTRAVSNGSSSQRVSKPAYAALQSLWAGASPTPTPPPSPTPAPDTTPPTLSITQPINGAQVSGKVKISAQATDNIVVSNVAWYLDGTKKQTDSSSPYEFIWDTRKVKSGPHTLTLVATDSSNNSTSQSIIVNK